MSRYLSPALCGMAAIALILSLAPTITAAQQNEDEVDRTSSSTERDRNDDDSDYQSDRNQSDRNDSQRDRSSVRDGVNTRQDRDQDNVRDDRRQTNDRRSQDNRGQQPNRDEDDAALGVSIRDDGGQGAVVSYIHPGSPAQQAGLRRGDRITSVEGNRIDSPRDLVSRIQRFEPGDRVRIEADRNRMERTFTVRLDTREDALSRQRRLGQYQDQYGRRLQYGQQEQYSQNRNWQNRDQQYQPYQSQYGQQRQYGETGQYGYDQYGQRLQFDGQRRSYDDSQSRRSSMTSDSNSALMRQIEQLDRQLRQVNRELDQLRQEVRSGSQRNEPNRMTTRDYDRQYNGEFNAGSRDRRGSSYDDEYSNREDSDRDRQRRIDELRDSD